jgi:hypothetical protein
MTRIWGWVAATIVMAAVLFGISQYDWRDYEAAVDSSGQRIQQRAGPNEGGQPGTTIGTGEIHRAGQLTAITGQLRLTDEQRRRVRGQIAGRPEARVQTADFTISVGASVPPQVELQDLPMELADTLGGYHGSQYLIVRDQVVIIDESRRIVAIIPNVG